MTGARRARFGPFELDLETVDLWKDGDLVRLQPQPLKVLLLLAGRAGHVVSRKELQGQVWQTDTFVDPDQGLNYCIRQIRATLGDSAGYYMGLSYAQQGAYGRALDAFTRVRLRSPKPAATVLAAMGSAQARAGQRRAALESLKSLEALSSAEYVSSYGMALLHLALGDKDRAVERLSKAYEEYSSFMPFLGVDPRLDEVRTDERFLALLARLNLPAPIGS